MKHTAAMEDASLSLDTTVSTLRKHFANIDSATNNYVISVKKDIVSHEAIELIMRSIVLVRKAVVWVDFCYLKNFQDYISTAISFFFVGISVISFFITVFTV